MNYIKITPVDIANGPGCRVVLWTAGCSHHCKECHNPDTWNPKAGQLFDRNAKEELFNVLNKSFIQGITLSGGDPLYKDNIEEITKLCKEIKEKMPEKDIWCYSGYTFDKDVMGNMFENWSETKQVMSYIDVLVDGKFEEEKKDLNLRFRGSANQRIIDVQESLKVHKVIPYDV